MSTATAPDPSAAPSRRANPYVGPRSFRYGENLYGRSREIADLRDLVTSERIVLLYSPSGAGKSSLVEAGLRVALGERDFTVLPTIRVSHEPPPMLDGLVFRNRYIASTFLSLEEARAEAHQLPADELVAIHVDEYLQRCDDELAPGSDACLVFDQFEELFTLDATDYAAKTEFLSELGVALRNRGRWALFSMREDFIAQLDPFLSLMPTRLSARYRLELLSPAAAKLAAQAPAESEGVDFTDAAADRLIDDLRTVHVQRGTSMTDELGPSIEPVQLQVVCRQLWDTLPVEANAVLVDDVTALGDVDDALAAFYVDRVAEVAQATGVHEREIRDWFDDALITAEGFRAQTLEGPGDDGPAVLRQLEDAHLIRGDQRRGARWYELAHDRLVSPIRMSNTIWRDEHLSTLQREAKTWDSHSRPPGLLMSGQVLHDAQAWAEVHPDELSSADEEYLQACLDEASRAQRERRASRRNLRLAILAVIVGIAAIVGLMAALWATRTATEQRQAARVAAAQALVGQAQLTKEHDPPLAMALAAEAHQRHPDFETDHAVEEMYTAFVDSGLEKTLAGHKKPVTAVAFSPDGSLVASSSEDGEVRIGDPSSGQLRWSVVADPKGVDSISFSPDGATLATANDNGSIGLWNVASGDPLPPLDGQQGSLASVTFSRDGSRLASGSDDGSVVIWDPTTGKTVRRLEGDNSTSVTSLAFDEAGATLAVGREDGTTTWWDPTTGRPKQLPIGHQDGKVTAVAFSPGGELLASSSVDGTTKLWDAETGREQRNLSGEVRRFLGLTFSPNGRTIATANDSSAKIWEVSSGKLLRTLPGHRGPVTAIAYSKDGSLLATGGQDQTVKLWTATTGSQQGILTGHEDRVFDVAFSPDDATLASASEDKTVGLWDVATQAEEAPLLGHEAGVEAVAFNQDGSILASAGKDEVVRLWDTSSGTQTGELSGHDGEVNDVAFSPDGSLIATAGADTTARIWDPTTQTTLHTLSDHTDEVLAVAFNPDGTLLATASDDGTVKLWDPTTGQLIRTLEGDGEAVQSVDFNDDGSLLASGGDDKNILLWNPETGRRVRALQGHSGSVSAVTFQPGGTVLASAGADNTIRLWDVKSGHELKTLTGHERRVWGLSYNSDGSLLASASADGTLRLWKPELITAEQACEIVVPHLPAEVLEEALKRAPKACTKLK